MPVEPEFSAPPPEIEQTEQSSADGTSCLDERLLDVVMHQTVAALDERTLAQNVDLPRLQSVARRHASDVLTLDPIVVELIEAVLETHLPPSMQSGGLKSKIARAVAQPLFDNPTSRGRLELLWSQLLGERS